MNKSIYKIPQRLDHGKGSNWGKPDINLEFYCLAVTVGNIYVLLDRKKKRSKLENRIRLACKRAFNRVLSYN